MKSVHCRSRRGIRSRLHYFIVAVALTWLSAAVQAKETIDLSGLTGPLDTNDLPANWHYLKFPSIANQTRYNVVSDELYGPVIRARSSSAAGGIARSVSADPLIYPILNWMWKINETIPDSSLTSQDGDDFPVRLMISFAPSRSKPQNREEKVLCYVWATNEPVESFQVNPVHAHVMTVVAASGNRQSGSWVQMSRNLVKDYQNVFSEEPGLITGLVLMTDSDNTKSSAQAWYGPVWLSNDGYPDRSVDR